MVPPHIQFFPHLPPGSRVRVRASLVWITLVLVAALFTLANPVPASAHAELERSDPPAEGLLVAPPGRIELWFTERVAEEAGSPAVRLLDADGRESEVRSVVVDPADPRHVIAEVASLAPGTITVVWSARSLDDGHTLTGTFAFRVGAGRAPGAASVEGERPPAWAVVTRWTTFLGFAVAIAGLAFAGWFEAGKQRLLVVITGFATALVASLLEPWLQTLRPSAGTVAPSLRDSIAALPGGWWLRPAAGAAGIALVAGALAIARRSGAVPPAVRFAGVAIGFGGLLGLSLTSHAAGRDSWRVVAIAVDAVHQWSTALWVGGLIHLGIARTASEAGFGTGVRRFSRVALPIVVLSVATGVANAGFVFPALSELWSSDYGVVLLVKVALLLAPLALAAYNRRRISRAAEELLSPISLRVRQTVRLEALIVLAVVLAGSVLALLAPPQLEAARPARADVPLPAFSAVDGRDILVHLVFSPGLPGENETTVYLTEFNGSTYTGAAPERVRLAFSPIAFGTAPEVVDTLPADEGGWTTRGTRMSLPGWWNITVTVRWLGLPDAVVPFYLLMPDPNLHGLQAPDDNPPADDAAAEAYARAMTQYTGLHRVVYGQAMANQAGTVSYGVHVVNDGSDGSEPGFTFDIPGGWQYVVLGSTAWSKRPGEAWEQSETNPMIPPSEWDEEYTEARGFQFGRTEMIDGELCQTITFVVPGTDRRVVAWYVWWVGTETGWLRQEMMVSQSHYMLSRFSGFNEPAPIETPALEATPTGP